MCVRLHCTLCMCRVCCLYRTSMMWCCCTIHRAELWSSVGAPVGGGMVRLLGVWMRPGPEKPGTKCFQVTAGRGKQLTAGGIMTRSTITS
jgi:hypothetical protein